MRSFIRQVLANTVGRVSATNSHSGVERGDQSENKCSPSKRKEREEIFTSEGRKKPRNSEARSQEVEKEDGPSDFSGIQSSPQSLSPGNARILVPTNGRTSSPDSGSLLDGCSRSPTPTLTLDLPSSDFDSSICDSSEYYFADPDILCHSDDEEFIQEKCIQRIQEQMNPKASHQDDIAGASCHVDSVPGDEFATTSNLSPPVESNGEGQQDCASLDLAPARALDKHDLHCPSDPSPRKSQAPLSSLSDTAHLASLSSPATSTYQQSSPFSGQPPHLASEHRLEFLKRYVFSMQDATLTHISKMNASTSSRLSSDMPALPSRLTTPPLRHATLSPSKTPSPMDSSSAELSQYSGSRKRPAVSSNSSYTAPPASRSVPVRAISMNQECSASSGTPSHAAAESRLEVLKRYVFSRQDAALVHTPQTNVHMLSRSSLTTPVRPAPPSPSPATLSIPSKPPTSVDLSLTEHPQRQYLSTGDRDGSDISLQVSLEPTPGGPVAQDIPPPVRPSTPTSSRPGTPEPKQPRPIRPGPDLRDLYNAIADHDLVTSAQNESRKPSEELSSPPRFMCPENYPIQRSDPQQLTESACRPAKVISSASAYEPNDITRFTRLIASLPGASTMSTPSPSPMSMPSRVSTTSSPPLVPTRSSRSSSQSCVSLAYATEDVPGSKLAARSTPEQNTADQDSSSRPWSSTSITVGSGRLSPAQACDTTLRIDSTPRTSGFFESSPALAHAKQLSAPVLSTAVQGVFPLPIFYKISVNADITRKAPSRDDSALVAAPVQAAHRDCLRLSASPRCASPCLAPAFAGSDSMDPNERATSQGRNAYITSASQKYPGLVHQYLSSRVAEHGIVDSSSTVPVLAPRSVLCGSEKQSTTEEGSPEDGTTHGLRILEATGNTSCDFSGVESQHADTRSPVLHRLDPEWTVTAPWCAAPIASNDDHAEPEDTSDISLFPPVKNVRFGFDEGSGAGGDTSDEEPLAARMARRSAGSTVDTHKPESVKKGTPSTGSGKKSKKQSGAKGNDAKVSCQSTRKSNSGRRALQVLTLNKRCRPLWTGPPSLFPFPHAWKRPKASDTLMQAISKATSLAEVLGNVDHQAGVISTADGFNAGPLMMHPPRPFIYDMESLIGLQGLHWDLEGFVAMELSAIPWLAFVGSCTAQEGMATPVFHPSRKRAQARTLNQLPDNQSWSPELSSSTGSNWDPFPSLYPYATPADWFTLDEMVRMEELVTESTE